MLTSSDIFVEIESSTLVSYLWINATYIILNFYRTIFFVTVTLVNILHGHKWALIWRFVFVCSTIIEHDFISGFKLLSSNLTVMVSSFTIYVDDILINLRILLMTHYLLSTIYLSGQLYHGQISIGLDYSIFHLFVVEIYANSAAVNITNFGVSSST